jgi:hypothetical protein
MLSRYDVIIRPTAFADKGRSDEKDAAEVKLGLALPPAH